MTPMTWSSVVLREGDHLARQQAVIVESEPAPSSTAQNVTVDEVIGAYRQACQKLNCRQIPKLLRQLQVWGMGTCTESVYVCSPSVCAHVCAGSTALGLPTLPRSQGLCKDSCRNP